MILNVGLASTLLPVVALNLVAGAQVKLAGPLAFKVAVPPEHITAFETTIGGGVGPTVTLTV